jgi:DNA-binding NarL/FixJ family response regulator
VLIADERLPLRARLRKLLEADPGFAVCGEVADAAAAVSAARDRTRSLYLDIESPLGAGTV